MLFHHGQQTCWPFAWMVVIELAGVACGASFGSVAHSSNAQPTNTSWVRDVRDQPFGTIDCPYVGATSFVLRFLLQPLVVAGLIPGALVGWGPLLGVIRGGGLSGWIEGGFEEELRCFERDGMGADLDALIETIVEDSLCILVVFAGDVASQSIAVVGHGCLNSILVLEDLAHGDKDAVEDAEYEVVELGWNLLQKLVVRILARANCDGKFSGCAVEERYCYLVDGLSIKLGQCPKDNGNIGTCP